MLVVLRDTWCRVFNNISGKTSSNFWFMKGVEAYYVFQSSSFLFSQYVFLIFKVSVTQSATWVIFTELILTSLIQILTLISSTIVLFFWRLVSDGNGSIGWDNTMYVEDHFFFVKQQKEGSNDLATHILRIVGRGSLLSLSHGRKLYK